jgi:hypothetical protein
VISHENMKKKEDERKPRKRQGSFLCVQRQTDDDQLSNE